LIKQEEKKDAKSVLHDLEEESGSADGEESSNDSYLHKAGKDTERYNFILARVEAMSDQEYLQFK